MQTEEYILDQLDFKILHLIANDTRISFLEVARICNVSGAAVHQRVQKMMSNGFIIGSKFQVDLRKIGYNTCAYLSLKIVMGADISTIIEKIKEIEEVSECHQIVGHFDLMVKIFAKNNTHLLEIIQNVIKPIGIIDIQSTISCDEVFNRQIKFRSVER